MSNYIDGFVLPIPRKYLNKYKLVVETVAGIWKEHCVLSYSEFVSEDLHLEGTRAFMDFADANQDEVIVFGWVVVDSRDSRYFDNKLVEKDPRINYLITPLTGPSKLISNTNRMVYGGFKPLVIL